MALGSSSNKIFLKVADGIIVQTLKVPTEKTDTRTTKEGKVVHELKFGYVEGIITDIRIKQNEFNGETIKSWALTIYDVGDTYQLEVGVKGGYGNSLIKSLANPAVDFTQPIKLTPWMKVVNEKKKTAIYVSQGDKQIDWYFTKETPNGLPDATTVKFHGKDVWDFYEQMQFLEKYVETKIKPQLKPVQSNSYTPPVADPNVTQLPEDDDSSDLPF